MAYKFPNKDPGEKLDFTVDWSRYLGDLTIIDFQWKVVNSSGDELNFDLGTVFENDSVSVADENSTGLVNAGQLVTDTTVTIVLEKGISTVLYTLVCQIVTSTSGATGSSIVTDRKINLRVVER